MGKKLLFFLAWLGIFCIGIFNIVYLILPSFIAKYISVSTFILESTILVLSIVYVLLAVYKLFSNFERKKDYQVKTPSGTVVIASSTICKYVLEVLQKNFSVDGIKVKSQNKRRGVSLDIKMSMILQGKVEEEIQRVQMKVMEEIQDKLGISIHKIKVHLSNIALTEKQEGVEAGENIPENEVK